jgi:hypothetical protein
MTLRPLILSLALLALGGCGDFPKDPRSTLERVRSDRSFRVGLVPSAGTDDPDPTSAKLLAAIGSAAHASPAIVRGETEVLLTALEEGHLDLVVGRFEKKSPWATRVTFGPSLQTHRQGQSELMLKPVMRNGENGWIALIEHQARDLAPSGQ